MIADIGSWMETLAGKLEEVFGDRLLFLGLQGSRGRGEAREDSDIDAVCVLDRLTVDDLDAYRAVIGQMPDAHLACGFICGLRQLALWPDYDLLGLLLDVKPVRGDLLEWFTLPGRQAARQAVEIGAANLYHALCHSYLYGGRDLDSLREGYKSAFFLLRMAWYLETGVWPPTGRALLKVLEEPMEAVLPAVEPADAQDIMSAFLNWASPSAGDFSRRFDRLFAFAGDFLSHYSSKDLEAFTDAVSL